MDYNSKSNSLGKCHHFFSENIKEKREKRKEKRVKRKAKRKKRKGKGKRALFCSLKKCPIFQGHSGCCSTSQAIERSLFYNP